MNRILAFASFVSLLGLLGACRREERPLLPTPTIFQIDQLLLRAGDTITITGEAFSPTAAANQVLFNGIAGRPVSGNLRTIRVIVPDGAGSGTLQVIRDGRASNRFPYEYEGRLELGEEVLFRGTSLPSTGIANFVLQSNGDLYVGFNRFNFFQPPFSVDIEVNRYNINNANVQLFLQETLFGASGFGFQAMCITDNGYQVYHYENRYYVRAAGNTGSPILVPGLELSTRQLFADANQNVYATIFSQNKVIVVRFPNGVSSGFNIGANIVAEVPISGFFPTFLSTIDEAGNIYVFSDNGFNTAGSIYKFSPGNNTGTLIVNNLPSDIGNDGPEAMFYLASRQTLILFSDNGIVHSYNLETRRYERYEILSNFDFEISHAFMDKDENILVLGIVGGGNFEDGLNFEIRRLRIR